MAVPQSKRLSLNISQTTADELLKLKEKNGNSLTEIIRNAVALYAYLDEEKAHNRLVQTVGKNGKDRKELVFT